MKGDNELRVPEAGKAREEGGGGAGGEGKTTAEVE